LSSKIHLAVDSLGNPLRVIITGGNVNDITQVEALLAGWRCHYVLADRGYAAYSTLALIHQMGAQAVIPPHPNAQTAWFYEPWRYRERHVVECCFNKLKHFRRVCMRFDKLAHRYVGFVYVACVMLWLR
jgi:transposase